MEHLDRIVAYWRACLADSARRNIDSSRLEKAHSVEITIEPSRSYIPSQIASRMVDDFKRKEKKKTSRQKAVSQEKSTEEGELVSVLICPIVARPKTDHTIRRVGREKPLTPVWIPARLSRDGDLTPSDEFMPWIPRDLLAPAQVAETIGNVEAMDHFLTHNPTIQNGENPDNEPRWIDVCQYSNDMLQRVVGQTVEEFDVKGYEREVTPRILLNEDVWFIPSHIIRLYDAILLRLEDESLAPPKLLPRLTSLRDEPLRPLLDENQRVEKSAQHLGYMEWRHPLSVSQREAVDHFLTLSDGEILAINGPPGTGKTTLLQSVVASLWVEAALHEREPPVIFASSSNNQAVTNVIDSFGDVPEDKSLLRGRWIPELKSYGLFCPSSSRAQEALDRQYQITTSWPNPSGFFLPPNSEKWTGGNIEDEAFISLAEQYFLDHCRDYMKSCGNMSVVNVKDAVRLLHRQLEEKINAIYQGVQTWLQVERIKTELSDRYGSRGGIETHLTQCANDLETCQKKIVQYREVQQGWLDHVDTVIPFFKQLVKGARNQEQGFAEKLRQAGRDWRDHADTILSFFKQRVKEAGNQERDFAEKLHQIQTGLSDLYGGGHRGIETHLTQCANDLETCQKKIVQYREVQQGWLDHVDTVIPFFKQLVKGARNQEQGFAEKLRQAGRDWRDHADTILSFFKQRVKEAGNQERDFAEKLHQIQTGLSDLYGGGHRGIETRLTQCANALEICQKKIVQYREVQQGWLDHVDTVIPFFKQLVKGARNQEQGFAEKLRQAGRDWRDHADTILSFFEQRVKEAGNQERDFAEKLHQIQTGLSDLYGGGHRGIETHLTQCANDLETCQKKIVQYREAQQGWLDHVDTMPWWMTLFGFLPWVKGRIEIRNRRYLLSIRSTCLVDPLDIKGIMDFFDGCVKEAENQERDCAERLHQIERDWRDHADTIFSFFDGCVKEAENQERDCAERLHQIERDWRDHADTIFSFFDGCVKEAENQERGFIEKLRQVERDWRDYAGTILSFFEQRIKDVRNQEQGFAEKLRQAKRDWARLQREEQAWDAWCAQHEFSTDRSSLLDTMDTRLRYTAFKLATHYWEGRWLLEMREQFNTDYKESQSEKKQKKRWRRYAKLAPCFVSTLYTLPNLMHAFNGKHVTLFDFIDLLIIDEAGQVSPDVSGATFALAKKALVVGDMQQIEPIWGITESIDIGNLREKKVVSTGDEDEISAFFSTGLAASSGNLMKVAQRASPYQKSDERGLFERGMFLTEHRRCVPEIIQYCNRLAYGGRLIPMRESEVDYPLPHLGYAHISGQSRRVGGSRDNRDEATVIVRWIAEHRDMLASHYSEKSLSLDQIVAIVTPFRPQANLLQGLLKKSGITESLKVGTVHILQGAECPVVIFSPVYGIDDRPPYFFDRGNSMLNVAVSRAKDSFLVFGNMNNFDQKASSKPSGLLASFLFQDEANGITQAASVRDPLFG